MIFAEVRPSLLLAFALAAPILTAQAHAHVGLEKPEAPRGASYKAVLKVPHGCDGAATHTVRVEIPEGFIGVKPMPKAGWTIKTVRGPYAQSYGYYHGPISEGVKQIEWSGGELPDEFYDEFAASGYLAKELNAGTALYFKVVQECTKGELKWVEIPAAGVNPHDLKAPAAVLKIATYGKSSPSAADAGSAKIGALAIEGAWTRATAQGAKVGAGYLTIRNTGATTDTLVSVETPVAGSGEIHDMTMTDDGVMKMRRLADGLEIPAGGSVELKPGGKHLMLMDLKQPLVEGNRVPVTLTFKSGATAIVELPVRALGATGHEGHGADKGNGAGKAGDEHGGHSHH
jgi:uncharacterized protein YcnI